MQKSKTIRKSITVNYSNAQPRDSHGRFSSGGGGGAMAPDTGGSFGGGGGSGGGKNAVSDLTSKDSSMKLSQSEKDAFETYISSDFDSVNTYLRSGDLPSYMKQPNVSDAFEKRQMQRTKETVDGVDSILAKSSPLDSEVTVFRGLAGGDPYGESLLKAKPGDVVVEKGFMSTTTEQGEAAGWGKWNSQNKGEPVVMHITAEKGVRGVMSSQMSKISDGKITDKQEHEFLLGRGTMMRVDRVDGRNVYLTAVAEGKKSTSASEKSKVKQASVSKKKSVASDPGKKSDVPEKKKRKTYKLIEEPNPMSRKARKEIIDKINKKIQETGMSYKEAVRSLGF